MRKHINITFDEANVERIAIVGNRSRYLEDIFSKHLSDLASAVLVMRSLGWTTPGLDLCTSILRELADPIIYSVMHRFIERAEGLTYNQMMRAGVDSETWGEMLATLGEQGMALQSFRVLASEVYLKNGWVEEYIRMAYR